MLYEKVYPFKLGLCTLYFKPVIISFSLLLFPCSSPAQPRWIQLTLTTQWCAAMQMDFSLHCMEEGIEETQPPFSPGSLLSRQPPVKTHDHHFSSLFITAMHRILTTWQFHIRWNSWPHHNVEIDLACCDFLSLLQPILILIFDGGENVVVWIFALFNYIWCREVRFDGAQTTQAAHRIYDNKQ